VADDQGHLKSISSETRLIAAHDDIARLCLGQETTETIARVEVIAGFTIVHVLDDLGRSRQPESLDEVNTAAALYVQAELLFAFIVLGAPQIHSYGHSLMRIALDTH